MRSLVFRAVRLVLAALVAIGGVLTPATVQRALAYDVFFNGFGGDSYEVFGPNAEVDISGDLEGGCFDIFGQYSAYVYVVPHGSVDPNSQQSFDPNAANAVINTDFQGGLFDSEPIGFTSPGGKLGVGDYDIIINTCIPSVYQPGSSFDYGFDNAHGAFSVQIPADVPALPSADIAGIKSSSAQTAAQLDRTAKITAATFAALDTLAIISNYLTLAEDPLEAIGTYAVGFYLDWVCAALPPDPNGAPVTWYCPTVGWGDVMRLQIGAVKEQEAQALHYQAIANDPPDSNYATLAPLDPSKTYLPNTADPTDVAAANLASQLSTESAIASALLHSIERYQGAQQASNGPGALLQAQAIEKYASMLANSIGYTNTRLSSLSSAASAKDLGPETTYMVDLQHRVQTSGFTANEIAGLHAAGLSDTDISNLRSLLTETAAGNPNANYTLDTLSTQGSLPASIAQLESANTSSASALQQLSADMAPIISNLEGQVGSNLPTASAGGPYTATVGVPFTFDASASTTPSGTLSYAWDLTGSGSFNDATGVQPTFTFTSPRSGVVGVMVTSTSGGTDVAYAPITVSEPQPAPSINSLTPSGPVDTVAPGTSVNFSANVTHTASGSIGYHWKIDGSNVSTGTSFTQQFTESSVGLHSVELDVSDAGGTSSRRVGVLVAPPVPLLAAFTPPINAIATDPVQFTDASTGPVASWLWDFGDGASTTTLQNPTHTYVNPGTYQVTLTVTDGNGATNQIQQPVVVQPFKVTVQDNFPSPNLNAFWTPVAGGNSSDGFAFTPAGLAITSSLTDYTPSGQTDPMIESTQSGDWTVQLQVKALVQQSYDMVGLLASDPAHPGTYWKIGYTQDSGISTLPSLVLYDSAHGGGSAASVVFPQSTTPYLQVVKSGTTYTFSYSLDGTTWTQLSQQSYPFGTGDVRIAPFAQGTSRTFTGTIVQFAFNAPLPGALNPDAVNPPRPTFADNFSGQGLNSFWSFNQGGNQNDSFLLTQGGLAINSSFTDYCCGNYSNPYIYSVQSGDFDLKVQVNATVAQNYDEVGIIAVNPSNPGAYWKDGFGYSNGATYTDVFDNSGHGGPVNVFPQTASPFLRVTRVGDVYTFYYSQDGTTWTQQYQGVWHLGDPIRLGLFTQGTSRTFAGRFLQVALNTPLPGIATTGSTGVLFDPTGQSTNVALDTAGASIVGSSSTYCCNYTPSQIITASPTAPWATGSGQTANQFATIQLANGPSLIDHVQIQPRTDCCTGQRPQEFSVEASSDGSTFVPVLFGTVANNASLQDFALSPPVVTKYLRYRPLDNWGDNCCISTEQFRALTGEVGGPTVTFQNLSAAGFGSFQWNFGDGSSSTDASPTHTYAAPGDYTVTLTASNGSGQSKFSLVQHVLPSTTLGLVAAPTSPVEGQTTQFTATLTPPSGVQLTTATLDFGDGTTAVSVLSGTTSHIFENPGSYSLTLTTTDNRGTVTTLQQPIVVTTGPAIVRPAAFFDPVGSGRNIALGEAGATVDSVSSTYGGCWNAQTLLNYNTSDCGWASGSGQNTDQWIKIALAGGTSQIDDVKIMPRPDDEGQRPVHVAVDVSTTTDADTAFTRVLTATLADDGTLQDFPLPSPVQAKFVRYREFDNRGEACCITTSDLKVMTGQQGSQTVTFHNLSAPSKITFNWDFGDGTHSTDRAPTHTFPSGPGIYTVSLQAADANGQTDSYQLTYRVLQGPVASFSFSQEAEGQPGTFSPTITDPNAGSIVQATWTWNDGSPPTVVGPGAATQAVQHTFPNNNSYTVDLQVVDDAELTGSFDMTVPVANLNPVVNVGPDESILAGQPLVFSTSVSRPGTLDVPSCQWDYGDGTTSAPSQDCSFNHTYTNVLPGQQQLTVLATLTATDPDGAVGTGSLHVTITPGLAGRAISGQLFYTRYCGGPNVRQFQFAFDGSYGFSTQTPNTIATTNGADGVIFDPHGDLVVAGQGAGHVSVVTTAGDPVTVQSTGTGSYHLTLSPDGRIIYSMDDYDVSPGAVSIMPLTNGTPSGPGVRASISGDDLSITSIAFDKTGNAYYTTAGPGGYGNFGTLTINGTSLVTKRYISSLPAAHGMVFDRFTGDLMIFGSNHLTQLDPASRTVVADRAFTGGFTFDQGTADGQGHILIADNGGHMLFMDYSNSKRIDAPGNFFATPYLDSCMDDVAPLSGVGSADQVAPISTLLATPAANAAGWNNSAVGLSFSATDTAQNGVTPSGVAQITATDGTTDLGCAPGDTCSATLTTEGTHQISYFATDNAGNIESPPHLATVKIDTTPPQTGFQLTGGTPNSDGTYLVAPTVTLAATDPALSDGEPGSGVAATYYQVVSHGSGVPPVTPLSTWSTYTAPFTISTDGDWDIYAMSADNAGNVATPVHVGEIVVASSPGGGTVGGPGTGDTPELDSLMLFASGLAGLAGYALRRRRARP